MPKPITPLVGSDVFILNKKKEILLIKRSDNNLWALPGGCQDLGESSAEGAVREVFEETGLIIKLKELLGVFSSTKYEYIHYPWKENQFCHIFYSGEVVGGFEKTSEESKEIGWFAENSLPKLSDGHEIRIKFGFKREKDKSIQSFFE